MITPPLPPRTPIITKEAGGDGAQSLRIGAHITYLPRTQPETHLHPFNATSQFPLLFFLQVCNTCTPVQWSTLDAPTQQQSLKNGNDNVALLMQGIHCFSERNVPPISLGLNDLSGNSPDHHPCDGDGFTFSPTSPDDSEVRFSCPSSASMSTSTSRSTTSSRCASFLANCSGGFDNCFHGGGGSGVLRSTMPTRYSMASFISSSFNFSSCIF